jgi:hypothetical protein
MAKIFWNSHGRLNEVKSVLKVPADLFGDSWFWITGSTLWRPGEADTHDMSTFRVFANFPHY